MLEGHHRPRCLGKGGQGVGIWSVSSSIWSWGHLPRPRNLWNSCELWVRHRREKASAAKVKTGLNLAGLPWGHMAVFLPGVLLVTWDRAFSNAPVVMGQNSAGFCGGSKQGVRISPPAKKD